MKFMNIPISLLVAFSVFLTTAAPRNLEAKSRVEIGDVFNKFRYDMAVEWDQQDPYFKEHAQKELENSLMILKAEGVTDIQILNYMQNNLLDSRLKKDFERLLISMEAQNLSEIEASQQAMKFMNDNYQRGTSFAGQGSRNYKWVAAAVGVVIVGVVTLIVFRNSKKTPSASVPPVEDDCSGYSSGQTATTGEDINMTTGYTSSDSSAGSTGLVLANQ